MTLVVEHLAELTGFRDRDVLDVMLVSALRDLLRPASLGIYRVVGDANRQHAWKNMTQEARQFDVLRPLVKEAIRVEVISRIPELLRRAFAVATSGRPGPVLIAVPEDIAHGEHDFDAGDFWVDPGTLRAQARTARSRAKARPCVVS